VIFPVLKLPSGQNKPLPYLLTLLPPLVLALLDPEIFFKALDFAGTYGGKGCQYLPQKCLVFTSLMGIKSCT
jgi:Tryptophan/tyrosine permease family